MPRSTYRPRIVVDITHYQRTKLNQYLAYGEQRRVFAAFINDLIDMLDEAGHDFVLFMLSREFTYRNAYYADRRSTNTSTGPTEP